MTDPKTVPTPSPLGSADARGQWRVLIVSGPQRTLRGVSFPLPDEDLRIGREGDFVLQDDQVSRAHAMITRSDDGPVVADLESSNGTFVNGARIEQVELRDGDVLRIGSHCLMIKLFGVEEQRSFLTAPPVETSIKGRGVRTQMLRNAIADAAPLDLAVMILGETGVGKELVANEVHRQSGRSGSFVPVNCAALPENLVESELFGHARGAFTGADSRSEGLFGKAHGGTLFLDEIGEMPTWLQAKLLRVLATGEVRAVGETQARMVDVRVVAATNVDLEGATRSGDFRQDLFSRLMGIVIEVPPLRRRREDIIDLTEHFLALHYGGMPISPDAIEALLIADWRYNVRELEQVVRVAGAAARRDGSLELTHLPLVFRQPFQSRTTGRRAVGTEPPLPLHVPRDGVPSAGDLKAVLKHFEGNVSRVAAFFGKDRRQVYRWAEKHGLELERFRDED